MQFHESFTINKSVSCDYSHNFYRIIVLTIQMTYIRANEKMTNSGIIPEAGYDYGTPEGNPSSYPSFYYSGKG